MLNLTSGVPWFPIRAQKQPNTLYHTYGALFSGAWFWRGKSCCSSQYTYTQPSSGVHLTYPKGPLFTHIGPLGPPSEPRINPKYPQCCHNLLIMVLDRRVMPRPQLILPPTPPLKSILSILKDPWSHIGGSWGSLGPHQSQEITQTLPHFT